MYVNFYIKIYGMLLFLIFFLFTFRFFKAYQKKNTGQVRVVLAHQGFRIIIYKTGKNVTFVHGSPFKSFYSVFRIWCKSGNRSTYSVKISIVYHIMRYSLVIDERTSFRTLLLRLQYKKRKYSGSTVFSYYRSTSIFEIS